MSALKLIVLLLGLVAVAVAVKIALDPTSGGDAAGVSEPKRQLDNVRARARELQDELQKKADRADVAR